MAEEKKEEGFTFGKFLEEEAQREGTTQESSPFSGKLEADALAAAGVEAFVPLNKDTVANLLTQGMAKLPPNEADLFKSIPASRQYVVGYLDTRKHGKGICTKDRLILLGHGDTPEELAKAATEAQQREITIFRKEGEPWSGRVTEGFELWTIKHSEWSMLPISADDKDEEARVLAVVEDHNSEGAREWQGGAAAVKRRAEETKSFKESEEEAESRRQEADRAQKDAEEASKELFSKDSVQKMAQTDITNQHLPWYAVAFLAPEGRADRDADRGILRLFGPFSQSDSKTVVKALGRLLPHACVRATQLSHVGSLETGEPQEAEEFVFADDRVSDWVQPSEAVQRAASNFDDLMTERQKLYLEMCKRRGVTPSIVEAGESKIEPADEQE